MSDITTAQGTKIKKVFYDVKKIQSSGISNWEWPHQDLSSRIGLSFWRRALVDFCTQTGTLALLQPLAAWVHPPHTPTN